MEAYTPVASVADGLAMILAEAESTIDAQHGFTALADQKASGLVSVASGLAGAGAAVFAWALTTTGVSALATAGLTAMAGFSFAAHCAIRAAECHDRYDARYWPDTLAAGEQDKPSDEEVLKGKFKALRDRIERNRSHLQACSDLAHRASVMMGWTPVIATLVSAATWLVLKR